MLKELFRPSAPVPISRREGVAYAEELADGIRSWVEIDTIVVPLAALLWIAGLIPDIFFGLVIIFAGACPIIMVLGFAVGCLKYLTLKECYKIVRERMC